MKQKSNKSSYPLGDAKEDWKIFKLISKKIKNEENFKSFRDLRENTLSKIKNNTGFDLLPNTKTQKLDYQTSKFFNETIIIKEIDYYFSNAIARSSKTMSDCRSVRSKNLKRKAGT